MTTLPAHGAWSQTFSGLALDYVNPDQSQISVADVSQALAHINRFCGHTNRPYSVAQHSLLVVALLIDAGQNDARVLLQGLVHDAPEAYIADIPAPLKRMLPDYRLVEERVWAACASSFGVPVVLCDAVKDADWLACRLEAHMHLPVRPLGDWAGSDPYAAQSPEVKELLNAICDSQAWTRRWLAAYHILREQGGSGQRIPAGVLL